MASITIKPSSASLHCANLLDHILCHEPDSMTIVAGSGQHQVSFNAPLLCTLSPLLTGLAEQSLRDKCCSSHDRVYVYLPDLRNWKILKLLKTFLSCGVVDYISKSDAENLEALLETLGINISTEVDVSYSVRLEAEDEEQFIVAIKYEVEANGNFKATEKSYSSTVIKVEIDQYEEIKKLLASAKNIGTRISTEIEDTEEGDEIAESDTHLDFLEENAQIDADRSYHYETYNTEQIEKAVMEESETGAPVIVISPFTFKSAALPSNAEKSKNTLRKKVVMEKRNLPHRKTRVPDNFIEELTESAKKTKRLPKTQNNVIPIEELYSCSKCNFKTKHKSGLEKHQTVHGFIFPCSKCDYTGIKSNLKKHEKSDHKYPCNQCEYIAVRNQNLRNHIKSVHEQVQYPCSQCDYKATRKANLKQHFDSIHAKIEYSCSQCDYKAKQRATLKQHVASEHDGIRYPCDKCDFRAKRKDALKRHYNKIHK